MGGGKISCKFKNNQHLKNIIGNGFSVDGKIGITIDGIQIEFSKTYSFGDDLIHNVVFEFEKKQTSLQDIFNSVWQLISADFSEFDSSEIVNMTSVFNGAMYLTEVNFKDFDTSKVTTMSQMFQGTAIQSVDLSSFNTENVEYLISMFLGCSSLKSIDLSSFNTPNLKMMSYMFSDCSSLSEITWGNTFDISKVTTMQALFRRCESLMKIEKMSFMYSSYSYSLSDTSEMFSQCHNIESVDLTDINTGTIDNASQMFYGCSKLKSLTMNKGFNASSTSNMFGLVYTEGVFYRDSNFYYAINIPSTWTEVVLD